MGEIDLAGDLVEVREGLARILVPKAHTVRGPGKVVGSPFYNRAMAFPRHISVLVMEALSSKVRRVLDGLASCGVLGIRCALEAHGSFEITLNDRRRDAHDLVKKNLEINGVLGARVLCEDLNVLLCREHFDYVDVDPFGSPVRFVDNALRSLSPRGLLAITATDTAALAGNYPRTCLRRYGAVSVRSPFSHEVGLRILVGSIVRSAGRYDLAARPLLAFWREHYYKVFFEITSGARRSDEAVSHLGYAEYQPRGIRTMSSDGQIGPLWTGPLCELALLESFKPQDYMPAVVNRYIEIWQEEAVAPPLLYTTDEVASVLHIPAPPLHRVLETLREAGFEASRTTFHPKGFKTSADWEELYRLLGPS
ncbi:MAG: tRNA (guanine(26)-N(2))-dimethyltransferase [Thermoplasmata archaeon]